MHPRKMILYSLESRSHGFSRENVLAPIMQAHRKNYRIVIVLYTYIADVYRSLNIFVVLNSHRVIMSTRIFSYTFVYTWETIYLYKGESTSSFVCSLFIDTVMYVCSVHRDITYLYIERTYKKYLMHFDDISKKIIKFFYR